VEGQADDGAYGLPCVSLFNPLYAGSQDAGNAVKVAVLGGGVVGVATAYYLAREGCGVTVIDRQAKAAMETSYGNAGLYTPSDSYAWASPDALKMAVRSLYRSDLGIKYKFRLDPRLWNWSLKFLFQCTHAAARRNSLLKLRLTSYSRQRLNQLVADTAIDYDGLDGGVLYFFRTEDSLEAGRRHFEVLRDLGLDLQVLDRKSIFAIDPGLRATGEAIAGGVYSGGCQTGDSHKFANNLTEWCARNLGVEFRWGETIERLVTEGDRVTKAVTDRDDVPADAFVLAAGAESAFLAERIGVRLPIYPVKGYSITAPLRNPDAAPRIGVVDEDRLVAMSRLGDRLRVASSAVFTGFDRSHRTKDFETIFRTMKELFPEGADYEAAELWAGLRPMTPTSVPILGRARYDNFFLNVGHGHVGWTMSCGSGKFVADCVAGRPPEIDGTGLLFA
jgi:D-amino-acid dehydrogenase